MDWFRARAAKARTDEEINLLLADSRATTRGFQFAAKQFRDHAKALTAYQSPGATAYALEKADMFTRMSSDCKRRVAAAYTKYREKMNGPTAPSKAVGQTVPSESGGSESGSNAGPEAKVSPASQVDREEEELREVFRLTQSHIHLEDTRVDYSIVSLPWPVIVQYPLLNWFVVY